VTEVMVEGYHSVFLSRLTAYINTGDHQCGFQHTRSTTDYTRAVCKVSGLTLLL
jgi:hypothetical protein